MENNACEGDLRSFIGQVVDYYRQCQLLQSGPIVFTIRMAAFALPEYSASEVELSIKKLADDGAVTILKEEPLSFAPRVLR